MPSLLDDLQAGNIIKRCSAFMTIIVPGVMKLLVPELAYSITKHNS
jgi:hypothetical protein